MAQNNLPIACSLTDTQLQQRRREVLLKAKTSITGVQELEQGFSYQFSRSPERIAQLASLVGWNTNVVPSSNSVLRLNLATARSR